MESLIEYLDCGNVYRYGNTLKFRVENFSDLVEKIIHFFQKGAKHLDYIDFVSVIELMKNKKHLTEEGLDKIRTIKAVLRNEQR
jgi:hypothetical protein